MSAPLAPAPEDRVIDLRVNRLWLRADGVIVSIPLVEDDLTLADAKENIAAARTLTGGRRAPLLVIVFSTQSVTHEARKYFSSPDANATINAMAYVASSRVSRMMGNLYLRLIRPEIPQLLFTSHAEALAWLGSFVR
jgi:hypothetical protein